MAFAIGDRIRVGNHSGDASRTAFTLVNGTATDPTAVTLTLQAPDGTEYVYGWPDAATDGLLDREAVGRFYHDHTLDQGGVWAFRLVGTGLIEAATESYVVVTASLL